MTQRATSKTRIVVFGFVGLVFLALGLWLLLMRASNDRNWNADQRVLATAIFDGDLVHVQNIRNFSYKNTSDYTIGYYDKTFNLSDVRSVDFLVEPFNLWRGVAHTLITFGFADGSHLAVSVEIRKEAGESYSPWLGMLKQYELMYVVADENDVIMLRTNYRNDSVYLYPMRTKKARELLVIMLYNANSIASHPRFYDTITSTCTTNIVDNVNQIVPGRIPLSWKILFPGYSDELAYRIGLIDTTLPFEEARQKFYITDIARNCDAVNFSACIRANR